MCHRNLSIKQPRDVNPHVICHIAAQGNGLLLLWHEIYVGKSSVQHRLTGDMEMTVE